MSLRNGKMIIDDLSQSDIKKFHSELGKKTGVRFVNSGPIAALAKRYFDKLVNSYSPFDVPDEIVKLMPCTVWRICLLPYAPGCASVSNLVQICTAVHEAMHGVRIKKYRGTVTEWYGNYFSKSHFRALEESSAWESVADVMYWSIGRFFTLKIDEYLVGNDKKLANASYNARISQLMKSGRGSTFDEVSTAAVNILIGLGVDTSSKYPTI